MVEVTAENFTHLKEVLESSHVLLQQRREEAAAATGRGKGQAGGGTSPAAEPVTPEQAAQLAANQMLRGVFKAATTKVRDVCEVALRGAEV